MATLAVTETYLERNDDVEEGLLSPTSSSFKNLISIQAMAGRKKLIVCCLGIFICYFYYGILQEKITRAPYGEGEKKERFVYTLSLVLIQCIINAAVSKMVLRVVNHGEDKTSNSLYAVCAFSYLGAMVSSNHALLHINYPTQVVGKSCKPIPVMILGVLLGGKRYPLRKYIYVLMIVIGVALFIYKDQKKSNSALEHGDHGIGMGEVLLCISLTLDGLTGALQERMRGTYSTKSNHMMYNMNIWSILYLIIACVVTGEIFLFIPFIQRYPWVLANIITFGFASAVGQYFIFLTVADFGPLVCSIVTTTRKFFTVLTSVFLFGNPLVMRQWLGTVLVFSGLGLDSVYGKETKKGVQQGKFLDGDAPADYKKHTPKKEKEEHAT